MAISQITASGVATDTLTAADLAPNSVDTSELVDDAVTIAKLAATGTASSSNFLRGDNTWTAVVTDLVGDSTPQLGGALDAQGNNITDAGNIETATNKKIKSRGEAIMYSLHRSWVMGG